MRRYFTRPTSYAGDDLASGWWDIERKTIDVFVFDAAPVNTGILDASGQQIMAMEHREQAAFVRFDVTCSQERNDAEG